MTTPRQVDRACWENAHRGRVDLTRDWVTGELPPIRLPDELPGRARLILTQENEFEYAKWSGYAINGEWIDFVAPLTHPKEKVYVAGEFNGWQKAVGQKEWELVPGQMSGGRWAILTVKIDVLNGLKLFKFVSDKGIWYEPHPSAMNIGYENGSRNYAIDYNRSGAHVFHFEIAGDADWRQINHLVWEDEKGVENIPLWPGRNFYSLNSKSPQGAIIEGNKTRFRLFAPRAQKVDVSYFEPGKEEKRVAMGAEADGCWNALVSQNLEGFWYYYTVEGPAWPHTMFDAKQKILDPWALAVRDGMGVVVDRQKILKTAPKKWTPPPMEDLIICEAHVRDLVAKAPINLTDAERKGFSGVTKLLDWAENPFAVSGINAVELQPLMEFDGNGEAYHWGYMTTNFFAPASAYASDRSALSQITELQRMIDAFHKKGLAVILDVVFNHIGVPAGPLFIDKAYYFRTNADGGLTNWSGCGNDLRVESAMAERMLIEALEHWVVAYGIDGFRFDLAELLGKPFLVKAQETLKKIKPEIILIAEPWSFKGHIGGALKDTDYASWNDGFREFVPAYLSGKANAEGAKYFIRGSVGSLTSKPSQSVNYVESHDDHAWIDKITQNAGKNGYAPTLQDRRQTHLMASLMIMSLGIPMWTTGMDALRSKYGVANTYLRGDLNAIDYSRMKEFPTTVEYFRGLNFFRLSDEGAALRVREPEENYLRFYEGDGTAIGVLYNTEANKDMGRIFYAINPLHAPVTIKVPDLDPKSWIQVADHERVHINSHATGLPFGRFEWKNGALELPAESCGIWVET